MAGKKLVQITNPDEVFSLLRFGKEKLKVSKFAAQITEG